jgi:cytochrome bd-type quinol oxidase subunit 2
MTSVWAWLLVGFLSASFMVVFVAALVLGRRTSGPADERSVAVARGIGGVYAVCAVAAAVVLVIVLAHSRVAAGLVLLFPMIFFGWRAAALFRTGTSRRD